MKIDVTYEKADIIRLVKEDLERRGLHLKPGAQPEYKGALVVKMSIEAVDDEVPPPAPPPTALKPSAGEDSPPPVEDDVDMEAVIRKSQQVAATTKPTFKLAENDQPLKRSLGRDESLDFPRE